MNRKEQGLSLNTIIIAVLIIIILIAIVIIFKSNTKPDTNLDNTNVVDLANCRYELSKIEEKTEDTSVLEEVYTNQALLKYIASKDFSCVAEIKDAGINFYPRKQRFCKRPIEFTLEYGSSMQPFLYKGDKFYVEKVKFEEIELGDVIVYNTPKNEVYVHSVTAIYNDFVITAGYHNSREDYKTNKSQILYRYCEV